MDDYLHLRTGDDDERLDSRPVTVREKRKGEGGVKTRDQLREERKKAMLAAQKRQEDRRRIMNGMAPIVSELGIRREPLFQT